ncbi:PilN domain-containing protein [Methyloterricola oryzae]|uniref:PilN domain-containing protein n=1 Tax=Methyloterricola oryzae TaxID=1495050 RepID=UPI0005EAD39E|nr:PilN domain-containing protein [Methyloterricola oryzae]
MLKLDTQVNLDVAKFFRWWGGELAFLIPERLRKILIRRRPRLFLRMAGEGVACTLIDETGAREMGEFLLDDAGSQQREALFSGNVELEDAEVILLLLPEQSLRKSMKLPFAAEENLMQVLAFEMDRLTPFKADQVYYAARVAERLNDTRQIKVEMVLTPRAKLDPLMEELTAAGWRPIRVDVGPEPLGYDLLPEKYRPPRNPLPQILNGVAAGIFLLLLGAVLLFPIAMNKGMVEQLQREMKATSKVAAEVESLKNDAEKLVHENGFLQRKKQNEPAMVDMLEEMTKVTPDQTWLNGLQYRDRKVVIQGQSPTASSLIERFEASPYFKNTSFVSPVTKDVASGQERFQIATEVVNGRIPEKAAE